MKTNHPFNFVLHRQRALEGRLHSRPVFSATLAYFLPWATFPLHAKLVLAMSCLCLVVGCEKQPPIATTRDGQSISISDPALISKLGITTQDWNSIEELAFRDKGLVIKDVERINANTIDLKMKKVDDTRGEQGGPVKRFQANEGHWMLQSNYDAWWAAATLRP